MRRPPGTLAERFWSIARSAGPVSDQTDPSPVAVVRHVLGILDALDAGEVGDDLSQSTVSFLALLRHAEQQGDLSYASPEQARGESLDERSLVFSVGVLLFEELTGRHPFGAEKSPRRFARIQSGEMGSGVQYFPKVPPELRSVLMHAMGPFPEERYGSLRELRAALERFLAGGAPRVLYGDDEITAPGAERAPLGRDARASEEENEGPTGIHRLPSLGTTDAVSLLHDRSPAPAPPPGERVTMVSPVMASGEVTLPHDNPPPRGRWRAVAERAAWAFTGAAAAFAVAAGMWRRGEAPRAAVQASVVSAPAVILSSPAAPVASSPPPVAAPEIPSPAHATAPAAVEPPANAGAFDPKAAGERLSARARECFAEERQRKAIAFGTGVLFSKDDGSSRRLFMSASEPITPAERACLMGALVGVPSGGVPPRRTIVEYRFRLGADGTNEVRVLDTQ